MPGKVPVACRLLNLALQTDELMPEICETLPRSVVPRGDGGQSGGPEGPRSFAPALHTTSIDHLELPFTVNGD